jgi:hypothetical protein
MQTQDDIQQITDMLEVDVDTNIGEPDTGVLERDTGVIQRIDLASERRDLASEIETIHKGYQQEIQQYQMHLAEMMEERNQLLEEYQMLEHRHQELYYNFLASVEEEAHRMVTEATRTITLSLKGNETPPLLRDTVETLEAHARQLEDEHTAHTLYLMREAQRKAALLEEQLRRERQQIAEERQNLVNLQNSVREQAQLRYKTIQSRLQARWKLQLVIATGILLVVLLFGQAIGLHLLRVPMSASLILTLIAPVFLCPMVVYAYAYLRKLTLYIYQGAPHRTKVKASAQQKA